MCVTICLRGKNLDPGSISSNLGQVPSVSFKRGDKFSSAKGSKESRRADGGWIYYSSDTLDSGDVNVHLSHVTEILGNSTGRICDDNNIESAKIDIFLSLQVVRNTSKMGNFRLCRDTIRVLNDQGFEAVVSYDVYSE